MRIVITGTSSGIGRFLAQRLAGSDHEIWGLARSSQLDFQQTCLENRRSFRFVECDVSSWIQVSAARQNVGEAWPGIEAIICCAAIQGPIGPAVTISPEAWSASMRINLDGTFFTIGAFFDLLQRSASPRAKIICFSGGGAASARPNFSAYATAKAGVVRLVENLAQEWASERIDINAVAPGAIHTRMTEEVLSLGPEVVGEKEYSQAARQKHAGAEALEKVCHLVDFLLSSDSDGISGRLISAAWDPWPNLSQHKDELTKSDIYTLRRIVPEDRGKKWSE